MGVELDRIDFLFEQKIKENKTRFKRSGMSSNNGIQVMEEKFKLEMLNMINNLFN